MERLSRNEIIIIMIIIKHLDIICVRKRKKNVRIPAVHA